VIYANFYKAVLTPLCKIILIFQSATFTPMSRQRKYQILIIISLSILSYAIYFCSQAFAIAAGYGAKVMCSAIFVSGRNEQNIKASDLHFFPLNHASCLVNYQDSSVTCSMFGFATAKAIYRAGIGATLVNDIPETEIRTQRFNLPTHAELNTDSISWPMGDKIPGTVPKEVDSIKINEAVASVFNSNEKAFTNLTRALMVVYDGEIIAEKYADGFSAHTRLAGWSMTKSITGAIVGILVKQHKLALDSLAAVPEWKNAGDSRHQITLRQLLQHTSGLDFDEVYNKPSDANHMLFTSGNAAVYAASRKLAETPGTDFKYSSGNSNIISRICRQAVGEDDYHAFPYDNLFYKLGMYHTVLEPDASGTFVGSSFCYATLRDWARFGLLYLNNGRVNGEQVLLADWVRLTTTPSTAAPLGEYGLQWWLNAGAKNNTGNRKFPTLPTDMYYASGYEGENIFIIPSKKLMVVRLGLTRNPHWGEVEFLGAVMRAIKN
jgi:CubicO group peptidase (beta-lactamase class C family)